MRRPPSNRQPGNRKEAGMPAGRPSCGHNPRQQHPRLKALCLPQLSSEPCPSSLQTPPRGPRTTWTTRTGPRCRRSSTASASCWTRTTPGAAGTRARAASSRRTSSAACWTTRSPSGKQRGLRLRLRHRHRLRPRLRLRGTSKASNDSGGSPSRPAACAAPAAVRRQQGGAADAEGGVPRRRFLLAHSDAVAHG